MLKTKLTLLLSALFCLAGLSDLRADDIKLKSGKILTGRITYEADDIVKIEVPISESIKETKIIARSDIEEIIKQAPDDVAMAEIVKLVPTQPLMPASAYKTAIETGPNTFLSSFPESKHVGKVQEIKATLEEELDKVERGYIKLEGEWISPQDQVAFKDLVDSRKRLLRMQNFAAGGNYTSYIMAMRDFEALEENYVGSPAFAKAVPIALEIVPNLGRQLQTMSRDVEYRNAQFEQNKAAMDPVARANVEAAREREEKAFEAALNADKDAGIKWVRLNPRSKDAVDDYISLAASELERLREYDAEKLAEQAAILEEVDKLIAEDKLSVAKGKLAAAASITGAKVSSGAKKKSEKSGSYLASLNSKLNAKLAEQAAKQKAEDEAKKSEALTQNLKQTSQSDEKKGDDENEASKEGKDEEGVEGEGEEMAEEKAESGSSSSSSNSFASLAKSSKKEEDANEGKSKSKSKPKSSNRDDDDEEEERDSRPPVVDDGEGFPMFLIPVIITVLLIIAIVVLKVLGIGGKKEDAGE